MKMIVSLLIRKKQKRERLKKYVVEIHSSQRICRQFNIFETVEDNERKCSCKSELKI